MTQPAIAQNETLDDRLDEERFLQGLTELQLPELLGHYIETNPPADPVRAQVYRIAAAQMSLKEPDLSAAERERRLRQVLQLRQTLIEEHPDSTNYASWLTDQAADLFFVLLPIEASWLTTEFGLPTDAQRQRVQEAAERMMQLTAEAEIAIEDAILDIESQPGYTDSIPLQLQRRRLSQNERQRRIPFLLGVATYLNAVHNIDDADMREDELFFAVDVLEPLLGSLEGALAVQARLFTGLAYAGLGEYAAAEEHFRTAATSEYADQVAQFAARMGAVRGLDVSDSPRKALQGLEDVEARYDTDEPATLFFRLLIADMRFRLRREIARNAPTDQQPQLLTEAFDTYIDLFNERLGVSRDTIRAIVFDKLATAAEADTPLDQLPPIVTVARAENLANESQHAEAIAMFEGALQRTDIDDRARGAALFGLGQVLFDTDDRMPAAQQFLTLARDLPADHEAERAAELAASIGAQLYRDASHDHRVADFYDEALEVLLTKYPNLPSIDRWRYAAGRLHLDLDRFTSALESFESIGPGADEWLDAQFMKLNVLRQWAVDQESPAARDQRNRELLDEMRSVRNNLKRGAQQADDPQRETGLQYYVAFTHIFEAEAQLELGEPQRAIEALNVPEIEQQTNPAIIGEVLRVRINALREAGQSEQAVAEIERFLDSGAQNLGSIMSSLLIALQRDVQQLRDANRMDDADEKAALELLPLARAVERWMQQTELEPSQRAALQFRLAEALRLGNQFNDAQTLYDQLIDKRGEARELLLGKAESIYGRAERRREADLEIDSSALADAMRLYKRLSATQPDHTQRDYWLSQLRMLQILALTNQRTEQIPPRVALLRTEDNQLGGDWFKRRFEALEREYTR